MSLVTLRDTIKSKLENGVEGLAKVYMHGGQFGIAELKRYAVQAPCVVLVARNIGDSEVEGGQIVVGVEWAAFVVTKDGLTVKRDELALALVWQLLGVITPEQHWDGEASHPPTDIKAPNLYSGELDKGGAALWAITWSQKQDLERVDPATLDDFLRFRSTTSVEGAELADTPTMEGAVDLPAPE